MTTVTASAAARVNIIGEHTDYNDGFVLPTATALSTRVTARKRADREINVRSLSMAEDKSFSLDGLQPGNGAGWLEYVKGVAAGLQHAGVDLPGADIEIDSTIPLGAGLSSSASLELSVANAFLGVSGASIPAPELALLCQTVEHDYAGVHCGIMDQYAVACAQFGSALLLDCQSLRTKQVVLPSDLGFILTDSGVRHSLNDGQYNNRAQECAAAVDVLAGKNQRVSALREVNFAMLEANRVELGEMLFRRCRHVVLENERVMHMVQALEAGDLARVGELLTACHKSLRDDFEVSHTRVDSLVEIANNSELVLGSRMVGGGFGGCVLSACRKSDADDVARHIRVAYAAVNGSEPWQHIVEPAHPARIETSI